MKNLLDKVCRDAGYLVTTSETDTTNIVCRHGHVYADGEWLVASFDRADRSQRIQAGKLGEVVSDGDDGELSVKFPVSRMRDMARIIKPRQASLAKSQTP